MVTNHFFSFLLISLHLPHLFTFSLTHQLPSFFYKFLFIFFHLFTFSLILPHNLILFSHTLTQNCLSLSNSMAPNSKKSSYVISNGVFNLTRWNGVVRLNDPLSLTHRPSDHLSENAQTRLVSFLNFYHS